VRVRSLYIKKEGSDTGVKLNGRPLDNLRFADDINQLANTMESLQDLTKRVDDSSKRMGLKINTENTKTMAIGKQHEELQVRLPWEVESLQAVLSSRQCCY